MKQTIELVVGLDEEDSDEALTKRAAARIGRVLDQTLTARGSCRAKIVRRSLDARRGRNPVHRVQVELTDEPIEHTPAPSMVVRTHNAAHRVVIAGSGPAGTFAAHHLINAGVGQVTIIDIGKPVQDRRHDIAVLVRRGQLDPTSNYCFGEGGAGTFSDGKLYTRTKDREKTRAVLQTLTHYGADPSIEVESRPHVGSNHLPKILLAMRADLESRGVTYRWQTPLTDLVIDEKGRLRAVRVGESEEIACDALVLATGHSARTVYSLCHQRSVALAPKAFAIGVRVEHPQPLIDELQYGRAFAKHPRLPAAFYELAVQAEGRGVYSFCMCPGGWIVDSSTEPGRLATNGMSLKRRDSPYANSALIVTVNPSDFAVGEERDGPLAGVEFQRRLEESAFTLGGGGFVAPAQRLTDFVAGKISQSVGRSSYRPGIRSAPFDEVLGPTLAGSLRAGVRAMERTMRGFLTEEAQLIGVETRTSAPVRVVRDPETCESPSTPGLFPCGEGAGFAGGIVSAAIDGIRVGEAIVRQLGN